MDIDIHVEIVNTNDDYYYTVWICDTDDNRLHWTTMPATWTIWDVLNWVGRIKLTPLVSIQKQGQR